VLPSASPTATTPTNQRYEFESTFGAIANVALGGSSNQTQFLDQFKAAVASAVPTLDVSDINVQAVQVGDDVIVQTKVNVDNDAERKQLQMAMANPESVFSDSNGFNTALYGVPGVSSITMAPTSAPTSADADLPRIHTANLHIWIAVACGICFVTFLAGLCVLRRAGSKGKEKTLGESDESGATGSSLQGTNQGAKIADAKSDGTSWNAQRNQGNLRLRSPRPLKSVLQ